jgi:hypothetical protein
VEFVRVGQLRAAGPPAEESLVLFHLGAYSQIGARLSCFDRVSPRAEPIVTELWSTAGPSLYTTDGGDIPTALLAWLREQLQPETLSLEQ